MRFDVSLLQRCSDSHMLILTLTALLDVSGYFWYLVSFPATRENRKCFSRAEKSTNQVNGIPFAIHRQHYWPPVHSSACVWLFITSTRCNGMLCFAKNHLKRIDRVDIHSAALRAQFNDRCSLLTPASFGQNKKRKQLFLYVKVYSR